MDTLHFTVDAKLLRELGERLVGRPHMALAELIKNAYDADARTAVITFGGDTISIVDDGHGMDEAQFRHRWMRIGTTAKNRQAVSPVLGRTLTGSKGVGRLAVQLLARELKLHSVALVEPARKDLQARHRLTDDRLADEIEATIEWPKALRKDKLTDVTVEFDSYRSTTTFAEKSRCGTAVLLSGLVDRWSADMFRRLAQEIWALKPPFDVPADSDDSFNVILRSPNEAVTESFDQQMHAIFDIASATVSGELLPAKGGVVNAQRFVLPDEATSSTPLGSNEKVGPSRRLMVKVKVTGAKLARYVIDIPDCQIEALSFEIRVFDLVNRQPSGVKVGVAREYLSRFGGVHIYDNSFRLPYYGPDQDWLRIEIDHAHRLSRSRLLPEELQLRNALQDLPNNNRLYGYARVSTSAEQRAALAAGRRESDALAIQITRDRLVGNRAFEQLRRAVRVGVDLYALERARTKARDTTTRRNPRRDPTPALETASEVVEGLKGHVGVADYQTLRDTIDLVIEDTGARQRDAMAYASLLGALATAGMTSLAYEHEISKQRAQIQTSARRLRRFAHRADAELAEQLLLEATKLDAWAERAERIRSLFRPLLDEESRTEMSRFDARKLVIDVTEQMSVLGRGAKVDYSGVPAGLQLPRGGYAAWSAVVQNLLTNAFRATERAKPRSIRIEGGVADSTGWLRVQNNGEGVDLNDASRLFGPFERGVGADAHAEALGLGGSGLGLTIVRMMLNEVGATAEFVPPEAGWSTAVWIEWRERT